VRAAVDTVNPCSESRSDPRPADPISEATLLRQARERRGLTLDQVAQETKIPLERLAALEQPGLSDGHGFYQRARIRAYARAVGLDERLVLLAPERATPPAAPLPVRRLPRARIRSLRGQHIVHLVACGVILAGMSRMVREGSGGTGNHTAPLAPPSQLEPHAAQTSRTAPAVVRAAPLIAQWTPPVAVGEAWLRSAEARTQSTTTVPTALVISTEPADARVSVNGIGWGSTPITIQHLTPGEKRIRVTKAGYLAVERLTRVVANRSTAVNLQLQPAP